MNISISRKVFNPHFLPILEDDEHFIILLLGGASSGKSYFSFQRAVYRCLVDKRKYLILRKHAVDVRRSCFEDVRSILSKWGIFSLVTINSSLMTVTFPNGSVMLFSGCDEVEKLKSIPDISDIIFEEASEFSATDYDALKMRLRGKGKLKNQIVLQSNPVSKANWLFLRFFDGGCDEESCLIDRSTYQDNPFCNQETIDSLLAYRETNPYYYRVYCLGEFGSVSRQVLTNWHSEDLDIGELRKMGYEHLVGMDFGFVNDATAIVDSLLDEDNKRIYVLREFYRTGLLNDEIAAQLKRMGLEKSTIIADSAEQKSIEEIRRAGIRRIKPSTKGQGSVLQGIQKLQQYEIVVDSSCLNLIEELENYSWKRDKATGEYINEPMDEYNHAIDALRYSLQCADARGHLKSLPRYTL